MFRIIFFFALFYLTIGNEYNGYKESYGNGQSNYGHNGYGAQYKGGNSYGSQNDNTNKCKEIKGDRNAAFSSIEGKWFFFGPFT